MDRDELKSTFQRVNAYRHVCRAVQASAGHSFFSACIFGFISFLSFKFLGPTHPIFLVQAGLALLELLVFFWKKLAPSVECVLVDSLVNLIFGGSILIRLLLVWQKIIPGAISPISLFIGVWSMWAAWNQFSAYLQLRRAFVERPSRAQMAYVRDMAADIRDGVPEEDANALDLPSDPPIQALLADDYAFLADPVSGDAIMIERDAMLISRVPESGLARLYLQGQPFDPFPISDANWRNYCRWKGEPA